MIKEINDFLINYGFKPTNNAETLKALDISKWADGQLYELDYYKNLGDLCSESKFYYILIPTQGYVTIFKETQSSYGNWSNKMQFGITDIETFKTIFKTVII